MLATTTAKRMIFYDKTYQVHHSDVTPSKMFSVLNLAVALPCMRRGINKFYFYFSDTSSVDEFLARRLPVRHCIPLGGASKKSGL